MNTPSIRQELHIFIDEIPEGRLTALKPLLADLAKEYWKPVIETNLTEEEHALIEDSVKRYHADPSQFVSLEALKQRLGKGYDLR